MADPASKYTDDQIAAVEKQLKSVYNQAYKDILQKQKDFNAKHQKKVDKYLKKVADGEMTQAQYDSWLKGQVFQGEQWEAKKKQMLAVIYNSNKVATDIMNEKTHGVFAFNATYANYEMEHKAGVNFGFGIYDTATVSNLIKNDPKLLPEWKIDQPKDYKWNQKKLNKQISLGIVEGESLDKIANRLCDSLCTQNFNKMRTFARTAMTEAQNSGRLFSYESAKELGIKVKKQWMATLDNHTRISHQQLDGQVQDTDKPFEIDGLKIRYPGDPFAPAALVFNCRCTLVSEIEDYPSTYDRYDNIDGKPIRQMTYSEWMDAKTNGGDISPVPLTFSHTKTVFSLRDALSGKDLSFIMNKLDNKEYNALYKTLSIRAKEGEFAPAVWEKYLKGQLSPEEASKIEKVLKKYADKLGIKLPESEIKSKIIRKAKKAFVPDINWVAESISGDKFKNSAKNANKARNDTITAVMKTPENYRKCFVNALKGVRFFDDNQEAYYQDGSRGISINFDKILKRDRSLGTLFHENGHAMDYMIMRLRNPKKKDYQFSSKDRTSQLPKFLSAIDKDLKYITDNIGGSKSSLSTYGSDIWDNGSKGVQDFISALRPLNDQGPRKGKIPDKLLNLRYIHGHSYDYYTRYDDPMIDAASELFANISGGYGDSEQMKYMQKYFPNSVKAFEEIIDEAAELIKK